MTETTKRQEEDIRNRYRPSQFDASTVFIDTKLQEINKEIFVTKIFQILQQKGDNWYYGITLEDFAQNFCNQSYLNTLVGLGYLRADGKGKYYIEPALISMLKEYATLEVAESSIPDTIKRIFAKLRYDLTHLLK